MNGDCSVYFHIPFCTRKCDYCHFYVLPDKDPFKKQLMEAFAFEWQMQLSHFKNQKIVSVYFGGGTPSLLGPEYIGRIIQWTTPFLEANAEITLEANPENINLSLMQAYKTVGVNRISIGIQSFDDKQLRLLGRMHDAHKAKNAVFQTAEAGIDNISIDLMYDIPQQTVESWKSTLNNSAELPITHLSLYNLTIEPHTAFFKFRNTLESQRPSPEHSLEMYELAIEMLEDIGLKQYEISAFAKKERESKHNLGYWIGRPFLGFGPSAFSFWKGKRFRNIANLSKYHKALESGKSPVDFEEMLEEHAATAELLAINLRVLSGVNVDDFHPNMGLVESLCKLEEQGLLERNGNRIKLSKKGILFYDTVASELVVEE